VLWLNLCKEAIVTAHPDRQAEESLDKIGKVERRQKRKVDLGLIRGRGIKKLKSLKDLRASTPLSPRKSLLCLVFYWLSL
jgi:hypothetical protein